MKHEDLTPDQQEKLRACKTPEELLELAKQEGYALSDEELEGISGGSWCPTECGDLSERCKSLGDLKW